MNNYLYIFLFATLFFSCSEPLEVDNDDFESVLIVEGHLTTELAPQSIRLTKSAKYGDIFEGLVKGVGNAAVAIRDQYGNNILLNHRDNGFYYAPEDFRAEIGSTYVLTIDLDGKSYNSRPQTVLPANDIDSLYSIYKEYPRASEQGIIQYTGGTDVYAKYKKQPGTANYYLWKYSGTFMIKTYPELYEGGSPPSPMPKPCCADCWKTENGRQIITSSFELGSSVADSRLFFLKDDGYRFYDKYVLVLTRLSLSESVYQFYKLIQSQIAINGDVFDPPPATIRGNIINIDDLDELVIGFFAISDVKTDTLEIFGESLPKRAALPVFPDDCLVLPNTTIEQPWYW